MPTQVITLIVVGAIMFLVIGGLAFLSHYYTLDGIKSKTVGDGQHGTARWATKQEIRQTYAHVPFEPELWRKGEHLPEKQGLVLGCEGPKDHVTALVDTDDIHAMVTAASGGLGRATADHLRNTGHQVVTLVRRPPQNLDERLWFPDEGRITAPGLSDVDAVINFCGAGIADERWSQQRKELLRSSRLNPTTTIVAALEPDGRCKRLLNGSAVGFYGNTGETMIDEGSPRGTGFLADLCADWEQAAQAAPVPTVTLRTDSTVASCTCDRRWA